MPYRPARLVAGAMVPAAVVVAVAVAVAVVVVVVVVVDVVVVGAVRGVAFANLRSRFLWFSNFWVRKCTQF